MAKPKTTTTKDSPSALAEGDRPTLNPLEAADKDFDSFADDSDAPPPPSTEPEVVVGPDLSLPKAIVALAPEADPPPPTRAEVRAGRGLYKVWEHGKLKRNGKTYGPGDTLRLMPEEAQALGCVVHA